MYAEVAKIYGKNGPSMHEIVRKKKSVLVLLLSLKLQELRPQWSDKRSVTMGKALHVWVEDEQETRRN